VHNEPIQGARRGATELFEAAAAKVNAAFVRNLDHAEAMPSPLREDDLEGTLHLSRAADTMLDGTQYKTEIMRRIEALDVRWRTEYDELREARQKLYDTLAADADANWPGIVAASGATDGFDPWSDNLPTRPVLLRGVRNRCGWEWSGREYGFAMNYQATVLGGVWEPHVLRALEYAWYDLKLDVNDTIPWDVIAVVEGPGKIGERTERVLRDKNGSELGTIEAWPDVDCVRLRVIGLHAGPVAVGPAAG
jgi:hypothetical protein